MLVALLVRVSDVLVSNVAHIYRLRATSYGSEIKCLIFWLLASYFNSFVKIILIAKKVSTLVHFIDGHPVRSVLSNMLDVGL